MEEKFAGRIENMEAVSQVVRSLFASMVDKDIISFGGGAPANKVLPYDQIKEIVADVISEDKRGIEALAYGPINGIKDLREIIASELLIPKGVDAKADEIFITNGGLEVMYLVCQVFINPGDIILVEAPTFVQTVQMFEMFEAKCIPVKMDDNGMDVVDLEEKIKKYKPKMVYVIPTFQNPSGRTLALERRKKIAELGSEYDTLILEDDPYRDIRFSGEDLPPIKAFDKTGHVILGGSFSKTFSPGVRLGYLYTTIPVVIEKVWNIKLASNSHTSTLPQVIVAEFFKRGYFEKHREMVSELYRERRDAMVASVAKYFPEGTKCTNPDGGLFCWVEVPGFDTSLLQEKALKDPDIKVAFLPGEKFFAKDGDIMQKDCMRLSYGNVEVDDIWIGIEKLSRLYK